MASRAALQDAGRRLRDPSRHVRINPGPRRSLISESLDVNCSYSAVSLDMALRLMPEEVQAYGVEGGSERRNERLTCSKTPSDSSGSNRWRAHGGAHGMTQELLERLSAAPLPAHFLAAKEVGLLHDLRDAGYIS